MPETGLEELVFFDSEPIIAYRVWLLTLKDEEPQSLRSVSYAIRWKPRRVMRSHCLYGIKARAGAASWCHPGEQSPALAHTCGIYALKDPAGLAEWGTHWKPDVALRVVGQVALWGKVLEHELGYRAEYAYPVSFVPPEDPEVADWLDTSYLAEGI